VEIRLPAHDDAGVLEMLGLSDWARVDWSATSLGSPAGWPQSLRSSIGLMAANGTAMCLVWGQDLTFLYNEAYAEVLGSRHPHALGRPFRDVWPDVWSEIAPLVDRALAGETITLKNLPLTMERHGFSEETWWTFSYSPLRDETGRITGMIDVCVETTEQVTGMRAQAAERDRQLRLLRQMPGFVGVLVGPDHVYEYVNDAYVAISGPRDFIGRPVRQVFPELEGQGFYELLDGVYASGKPYAARQLPITLWEEATPRYIDLIYEPIRDETGATTGIFVGGYDVTEASLVQEALRESEASLRHLNQDLERKVIQRTKARGVNWQVSPDLMGALNSEGYFETSNPAWLTILGWTEAEVATMSIFELLHPDDVETTRIGFAMTQIGEPAIQFPNRYRCKDGSYRWISWVGVPEEGYVYCTGRDITEERAKEAELGTAREALLQAQKLDAMGQLTGGVAHDFNNLLTPVIGGLDLLKRRGFGGDREHRILDGALQSAERARILVQRLLAFARRQPLQAQAVALPGLLQGMADLIDSTTGPNIRVEVELDDDLPLVSVDANQLEMAILNLAVNARDAMPDGGRLAFSAHQRVIGPNDPSGLPARAYVLLCVQDTGTGMDEATLQRAIEPFFSTKGIGKGTGLGLSMVHGLLSQMGGGLTLVSSLGEGTTAEMWLRISMAGQAWVPDDLLPAHDDAEAAHGRVLLVDDEDLVRTATADMLADLGYTVIEANSGEQALELLGNGLSPDVIVTDHLMPGMTGVDLTETVRKLHPGTPILIVSGYAEMHGIPVELPRLTKPFRMAELATVLKALRLAVRKPSEPL
jgi:PAS domain S-box-containing protein